MLALTVALLLTADPNLAGKWQGSGFTIVLEAGGTGTVSDGPMVPPEKLKWKVSGNSLMITQDGDTLPYAMKLAGDTLTLSSVVLEAPLTLKRIGRGATAETAPAPKTRGKPEPAQEAEAPQEFKFGTCETACQHYLSCAKLKGAAQMNMCIYNCVVSGANPYQLGIYNQLDCQRAIMVVVSAQLQALQAAAQGGNGNRGGGGNNKGSRCSGCVRDGSSCVWISQSNWGTGNNSPYSGAVSSCDADCCQ